MHNAFLTFALVLCFTLTATRAATTNTPAHHTIWRVEGKSNVVYLIGSVHLLKESDYPLPAAFEQAYTNSGICAFETDVEQMNRPTTQVELMSKASLPDGVTLKDQLSEPVYRDLQRHVTAAGLGAGALDTLKPAFAALTLTVIQMQKLGADPEKGIDQYFFNRAGKDRKTIVALETVDSQIALLTGFTKSEGEDFLKSLLEQIDQVETVYNDLVKAWKNGDTTLLEKVLNDSMRDSPELYSKFITGRNKEWLPRIEKLLDGSTNAVVIVGAGHLIGPDSVVDLLARQGRKLRQL